MKNLLLFILLFTFAVKGYSQSPQGINYQAVIRNSSGSPISSQNVGIKFSIRNGSSTVVYSETHAVTTNAFGLVNLVIGQGTIVSGTFNSIDWGNGTYTTELAVDNNGGTNYVTMGSQQLMSVPYALYALKSGNTSGTGVKPDTPYTAGTGISIANHVVTNTGDLSNTNEIQDLTLTNNSIISLSNSSATVVIPTEVYKINNSNVSTYTNGPDRIILVEGTVTITSTFNGFCGNNNFIYGGTLSGSGQAICFNNFQTITGTTFTNLDLGSGTGVTFINCTFNNITKLPPNSVLVGCLLNGCAIGSASQIYQISDSKISSSNISKVFKLINTFVYGTSNIGSTSAPVLQVTNCSINESTVIASGSFTGNTLDNSTVTIKPFWSTITCTGNAFEGNAVSRFIEVDFSTGSVVALNIGQNTFRGSTTAPSSAHILLTGTYTGTRFMCKISSNNFIGGTGVCVNNSVSGNADIIVSDNDHLYTGGLGVTNGGFVFVRNNQAH